MSEHDDAGPGAVGTLPRDAPVTREELERALRRATLTIDSVRDDVIQLAAQVVALTEELERRDAGVEAAVDDATPEVLQRIRVQDERSHQRVLIGDAEDKYLARAEGPDCESILPICQGRCCQMHFWLSTQDLDEGVIRWDYGRPYLIKQRIDDGYCVHNHPTEHRCTVYRHRPRPCRQYDCRNDPRVWKDFERRELADPSPFARKDEQPGADQIDLVERVRARQMALAMESFSLNTREAERRRLERAELARLARERGE